MALATSIQTKAQTDSEPEAGPEVHRATAVRFHRFGGVDRLALENVDFTPPAGRKVLVATVAAALNPKDILIRKGRYRHLSKRHLPITPGFDFAGRVIDSGPRAREFKPGDCVFGMLGGMGGGACAELIEVSERRLCRAPAEIDLTELATVPLAGLTAYQALARLGRLEAGKSVCINGASGGVGTLAIQIARRLGALVTTLSSERNRSLCRDLGAHCALDYRRHPRLGEHEFDVVFDVFGNLSLRRAKRFLASDGIYVTTIPSVANFRDQLRTSTSLGRRCRVVIVRHRRADLQWLADALADGGIRPVVDRCYPLNAVDEAFAYLETKRARGKVAVSIQPTSPTS